MKAGRLAYLDGLRGVAAVVVVIHHLMIAFYPASYTRGVSDLHTTSAVEWLLHDTPLGIVNNGGFAVAIFLVLSGFVASLQFKKSPDSQAVADSIIKRFIRFLLPIFVINLIAFGLLYFNQRWNLIAAGYSQSYWWLGVMWQTTASLTTAISQTFGSLFKAYPLTEIYNSSVWTMPFFFLGAVMVSMISLLTLKYSKRWLIYIVLVMVFLRSSYWLLLMGMMLEQHIEWFKPWFAKLPVKAGAVLMILFLGNYPQYYSTAAASKWYGWLPILSFTHTSAFYQGLAACLLLVLLIQSGVMQKILSQGIWLFLGKISFSLYLFHILVINTLTSWLFVRLLADYSYSLSVFLSVLSSLPVMLLGSWLIFNLTEKRAGTVSSLIHKWLIQ